jgi:alpha/beta superfamily hydrolase
MKPARVSFTCGDLKLEGLFFRPESTAACPAVVVCHPHPQYGGSMHNNVTCAIADALVKAKMAALLFNFRGVGGSQGNYGGGEKEQEQEDVQSALDWLEANTGVDKSRLGVAGYSFGGGVAFPAVCGDSRVKAIMLVSPYFEKDPAGLIKKCTVPKLMIAGSDDYMVSAGTVEGYYRDAAEPKKLEIIKGADHFWGGYENKLSALAARFFQDNL